MLLVMRIPRVSVEAIRRVYATLDWLVAKTGRRRKLAAHLVVGKRGEELVLWHLMRAGYVVVAERWNESTLPGDLDLVAWRDEMLCFIEVKTRTTKNMAPAEMAVDQAKRRVLRGLAGQYLRQVPEKQRPRHTRFDIATVYMLPGEPVTVRVIENAFGWSEHRNRQRGERGREE